MNADTVTEPITASIEIDAGTKKVYELIVDIPRMGQRSPECRRCEWVLGDRAAPGVRFKGWNRQGMLRWSTICEIEIANGEEFTFAVILGAAGRRTRWRYLLEPTRRGSRVTETCEPISFKRSGALAILLRLLRGGGNRAEQVRQTMEATLANLKREAEALAVA